MFHLVYIRCICVNVAVPSPVIYLKELFIDCVDLTGIKAIQHFFITAEYRKQNISE